MLEASRLKPFGGAGLLSVFIGNTQLIVCNGCGVVAEGFGLKILPCPWYHLRAAVLVKRRAARSSMGVSHSSTKAQSLRALCVSIAGEWPSAPLVQHHAQRKSLSHRLANHRPKL